jgi:hypothetical protein
MNCGENKKIALAESAQEAKRVIIMNYPFMLFKNIDA